MFTTFNKDNEYQILSYLNPRELFFVSKVSKEAYARVVHERVWGLFFRLIPLKETPLKTAVSLKGLLKHITTFSQKIGLKENGVFYCHFQKITKGYIEIKVWHNQKNKEEFQVKESCWFLDALPQKTPLSDDNLTIDKKREYMIHMRLLPETLNPKTIRNQIIGILRANEAQVKQPLTSWNFKARTGF